MESQTTQSTTSENSLPKAGGLKKKYNSNAEWRKGQKSVSMELGWGRSKEGCNLKRKHSTYSEHKSVMECPICGNHMANDIIDRRADYLECRKCGYESDIDNWDFS